MTGVKERIQKVLGNAGVASRRNIEEMVQQGRVAVNGKVMTRLPILIDPAEDRVTVDDEPIKLHSGKSAHRVYLLMNKPKGVYTTNVAQGEQTRVIDLLPADLPVRVYPVGRLDSEAKGLILLTNDGELTNRLTHPRYGVPKTYRAIVDGRTNPESLREIEEGIWLADPHSGKGFKTGRCHIKVVKKLGDRTLLEITLREGQNGQIRRMLAKIGHKVRDLTRVRMGPLTLHGLAPGQFRSLTSKEVRDLREAPQEKPRAKESRGHGED